jgi:hypothetical protein
MKFDELNIDEKKIKSDQRKFIITMSLLTSVCIGIIINGVVRNSSIKAPINSIIGDKAEITYKQGLSLADQGLRSDFNDMTILTERKVDSTVTLTVLNSNRKAIELTLNGKNPISYITNDNANITLSEKGYDKLIIKLKK